MALNCFGVMLNFCFKLPLTECGYAQLRIKKLKNMITEKQYLEALNIIEAYEEQLRIANVSKSLLTCCKCGEQVKDLNDGLCYPCWNERYEASK